MDKHEIIKKARSLKSEGDNAITEEEFMDKISDGRCDPEDILVYVNDCRYQYYMKAIVLMETIEKEDYTEEDKVFLISLYDSAIAHCGYNRKTRDELTKKKNALLESMKDGK